MSSRLHRGLLALGLMVFVSACGPAGDESISTEPTADKQAPAKADPPVSTATDADDESLARKSKPQSGPTLTDNDVTTAAAEEEMDDEFSANENEDDPSFVPPSPDSEGDSGSKAKTPLEKRDQLTGKWFAVMSSGGVDVYMWLLDVVVSEDGEKRELKVVDALDEMENHTPLEVRELTATEAKFAFTFTADDSELTLDVEGRLHDGIFYGNVIIPGGESNPIRLIPTKAASLKGHDKPEETEPGRRVLSKVVESKDPFASMREFTKKYNTSPISLDVHKQLIAGSKDNNLEPEVVKEVYNEFVESAELWGSRMVYDARLEGAILLAFTGNMPEYALELFDELEQSIPAGMEETKAKIEVGRDKAQVEIALRDLDNDDDAIKQAAYERLQTHHDKNPFDPNLIFAMAQQMEKLERTDEAIELYAELASLPMLEDFLPIDPSKQKKPSETLSELWNKKHGNTDGLDEYLNEVYEKRIHMFVKEPVESTLDGNKVHLVELFTGSSCPPCVAADIATGGIEVAFSPSDVVVIRYHQHIPGPDPLSNEDSEARLSYYPSIRGTPTTFLNGAEVAGLGGYLPQSLGAYERLKQQIADKLGEASDVRIELQASGKGPEYTVAANVSGLPEDANGLKLRIALAEKEIHFLAGNGVRVHEMVVRALLGGPDGVEISPENGTIQQTVNLDDLKNRLTTYLKAFEEGQDVEFDAKPVDLNRLQVVAFVQNDDTQEILQAASIPLTAEDQADAEGNTATGAE